MRTCVRTSTTGLLFLASFQLYGLSYQMILVNAIIAMLLVITIIDFRHYIIPDVITIPGIVVGLATLGYRVMKTIGTRYGRANRPL